MRRGVKVLHVGTLLRRHKNRKGGPMASLKDVERLADDLETLVGELRSELSNGQDFERLVQIADDISEHADNAAQTFTSVNEALMQRLDEVTGKRAGGQPRKRQTSSSSSSSSS
jgi:hypothetical protein